MAIDGGWGIGKSTLLRQVEANLAHEGEHGLRAVQRVDRRGQQCA